MTPGFHLRIGNKINSIESELNKMGSLCSFQQGKHITLGNFHPSTFGKVGSMPMVKV